VADYDHGEGGSLQNQTDVEQTKLLNLLKEYLGGKRVKLQDADDGVLYVLHVPYLRMRATCGCGGNNSQSHQET